MPETFAFIGSSLNVALHIKSENVPAELRGQKIVVEEITLLPAGEGMTIEIVLSGKEKLVYENMQYIFQVEGTTANGQDEWGHTIEHSLANHKMSFHSLPRPNTAITVTVQSKKGESTLFCEKPPYRITSSDIDRTVKYIRNNSPRFIVFTGVRDPELELAIKSFEQAPEGTKCVFMPHLQLLEAQPEGLQRIYELSDIFQVNERETKVILGIDPSKKLDPNVDFGPAVDFLNRRGGDSQIFISTLGERGAAYVAFSEDGKYEPFICEPNRINPKDTTGSGDAFLATILWAINRRFTHSRAVSAASFVASQNALYVGGHAVADDARLTRDDVLSFIDG